MLNESLLSGDAVFCGWEGTVEIHKLSSWNSIAL